MSLWLKQSTAVILNLGPFVDETDGKTAETGLTIAQADIQISKNGGAFALTSDPSPTTTHDADGWYPIPLTTTDTGTLGTVKVHVAMSGALAVWQEAMVVPANVWDSMFGADKLQVDTTAINNSNSAAVRLALSAGQIIPGTVDNDEAPTATVFEADDITEATADHFNGRIIIFTSGDLAGQATDITDYELNGSNGKFTVTALTEAPANDDTFVIV